MFKMIWIHSLVLLLIVIGCEKTKIEQINPDYINFSGEGNVLDIKYSNIVYKTTDGREIILPIFRGNKGNVEYKKLTQYCINIGKLDTGSGLSPFFVKCKKNQVKETFHEFLTFYKSNILKNINIEHPTDFGQENMTWIIFYDFLYNNMPCYLLIQIQGSEKSTMRYESVYDIQPDETEKMFTYRFGFNVTSPWKK